MQRGLWSLTQRATKYSKFTLGRRLARSYWICQVPLHLFPSAVRHVATQKAGLEVLMFGANAVMVYSSQYQDCGQWGHDRWNSRIWVPTAHHGTIQWRPWLNCRQSRQMQTTAGYFTCQLPCDLFINIWVGTVTIYWSTNWNIFQYFFHSSYINVRLNCWLPWTIM